MTEKRAAKFSDYDNKALLSSGSESDQEYTDIFESIGTGQILLSTSFDDGDSKSVSDSEIVGYTGDIETYIGSNNDESDCNETVPKLPEDQLIDFRSESTVNNQISKDEGSLIKGGLSEFNKKLLVITNEKNLRPGKAIQVKPMEDLNTSKSDIQSEHDHTPDKHNTKTILEDEVTKPFEVFDPLSEKNVNESSLNNTSSKTSNKQVKHSNRKRPRHRIYLDDPDIHQLISEHVELLRCKMAGVDSKEILKVPSFNFQSHHMTTMPDFTSHNNTATKKKIALNGLTSNLSSHIPTQQNYSMQFKSNQNLKTRRGQNLISRIRNENISSEDDDEYTERLAKALYEKNSLHQICPDCGEYHSQEEDDEDICPDCGVSHNPYQHSPIKNNSQKKIERDNSCIKTNVKSGNRYQQITSQQDPRDEMEDSLPSIEGPLSIDELTSGYRYRLKYLGSCQIITQHPVTKETRLQQAQDAYKRIKAQDGEDEVSTNVDMCISLERIKVINKDTKFEDVMMDHALRTVCFICDMGKILVLMARRLTSENSTDINFEEGQPFSLGNLVGDREKKSSKNICHVFEGVEDTSSIAKAIGQAFNVAYRQFLKSNGIAHELVEEAEYSHVLESQIIIGRDLENLTDESAVREVVVVKKRGDPLGIMLLESGWGSMLPTVFVAHIANYSATAQCQKISVGDHILACDGISLVGLPLSECTAILKNCRAANRVSFRVVTCPTVVDVVLLRPDVKYQLGFSVQDGTICSMLRGGIAERAGVRVGHRIIEINGDSVVAKSHQYIIDILAHTIGSISMKTMPIALYRLMVGEELPQHV